MKRRDHIRPSRDDVETTLLNIFQTASEQLVSAARSIVCSEEDDSWILRTLESELDFAPAECIRFLKEVRLLCHQRGEAQGRKKARVEEKEPDQHVEPEKEVEVPVENPSNANAELLERELELIVKGKLPRDARYQHDEEYVRRKREEARRGYLKKREPEQEELKRRIIEERSDWLTIAPDELISNKYREDLERERQALQAAKEVSQERGKAGDLDAFDFPDEYDEDQEKRLAVVRAKVGEAPINRHEKPKSEMDLWEERQVIAGGPVKAQKKEAVGLRLKEGLIVEEDLGTGGLGEAGTDADRKWMDESLAQREERQRALYKLERERVKRDRELLPVYRYRQQLLKCIRDNNILVIEGETGSGKTTQIPQYLHEVGYTKCGQIAVTQPRRVAAMSVAARVAHEMGCSLGREVGYSIRFENRTSDSTKIKYLTDGSLLQEMVTDPELKGYSVVMIDEAHERTIHTDVLFVLLRDLARYRPTDFKLLVSSATMESEKFANFFDDAPIVNIPGRKFEVEIFYTPTIEANWIEAAILTVLQIHKTQPDGDMLVFLPGQQEIEECQEELISRLQSTGTKYKELRVLPMYSALPSDQQAKVFDATPVGSRKCVLATNIAETSITIDNIVYVIDSGYVRHKTFTPKTGIESLSVVPCSQASANQRAGRAGRVRPGMCFRLYTKLSFETEMEQSNLPEILRSDLTQVVLCLKLLGIDEIETLEFMDSPPRGALETSLQLLNALGALDDTGTLTTIGWKMSVLPIEPMLSRAILASAELGCVKEVCVIGAMLEVANGLFYRSKRVSDDSIRSFYKQEGDHFTLLNVYSEWEQVNYSTAWCFERFVQSRSLKRARDIFEQLEGMLEKVEIQMSSDPSDSISIRKALIAGFFLHVARLNKMGQYRTVKYHYLVDIHPASCLIADSRSNRNSGPPEKPIWRPLTVLYHELVQTSGKEYMRNVVQIEADWLREFAPQFYRGKELALGIAKMPKGKGKPAV